MAKGVIRPAIGALALSVLALTPALPQKAKDTLRVAVYQPIATTDNTFEPQPQTSLFSDMVFDYLTSYDNEARKVAPLLAESWTQLDPLTVEFKLRKDVKFHNGQPMDADDVVYSFNFVTDPKVVFRTKASRYGIFDRIEKIDQYTVRIKTKQPYAPMLRRLASNLPIVPRDAHKKYQNKADFGRNPIGSGPYKAIKVSASEGIVFVRNDYYPQGGKSKPKAKIGRVEIAHVPDAQTQMARLMTNQQDLMYDLTNDAAEYLKSNPSLEIDMQESMQVAALIFDMSGRSGIEYFKDVRIREALLRAIDRRAIARAMLPKELADAPLQDALCNDWYIGCAHSAKTPGFDLARAKKLLVEAGKPDGFNVTFSTWGPALALTEAIDAQWRKIGVKATIESLAFPAFVKKRSAGQFNVFIALYDNAGGQPDVDTTASYFFEPEGRNYIKEPRLVELVYKARQEMDPVKRDALYKEMFDRNIQMHYAMPIINTPVIVAHGKELNVPIKESRRPEGFELNLLSWK